MVNDSANSPNASSNQLAAHVWFAYPQTGTFKNFLSRKNYTGMITIRQEHLALVSDEGSSILDCPIDDIAKLTIITSAVTIKFKDGKKFAVNFAMNRQLFFPWQRSSIPNMTSIENLQPFLDYFSRRGLL